MTLPIWPPVAPYQDIPAGTTWPDLTAPAGAWTSYGALTYIVPYAESPRETLAAAFLAAIGDVGVQVYAEPPEVPAPPCVVIRPADPYQAPYHAGGTRGSAWAFDVDILLRRQRTDSALRSIEYAREVLTAALPAGWRWVEFGEIGEVEVAKKTYLKGTLGVAVALAEGLDP